MSSNNRPQKGQHLNTRFFMATLRPPKLMQVCNMSPCTPLTELCSIQVSGNWLAIKALLQFCILLDHTSVPASSLTEAVRYKDESINRHLAKCLCAQSNHSHSLLMGAGMTHTSPHGAVRLCSEKSYTKNNLEKQAGTTTNQHTLTYLCYMYNSTVHNRTKRYSKQYTKQCIGDNWLLLYIASKWYHLDSGQVRAIDTLRRTPTVFT